MIGRAYVLGRSRDCAIGCRSRLGNALRLPGRDPSRRTLGVALGPIAEHAGSMQRSWDADQRDRIADERDRLADERDRVADLREAEADEREAALDMRAAQLSVPILDVRLRAAADVDRSNAMMARSLARIDRDNAWADREQAAIRRETAATAISRWSAVRLHYETICQAEASIRLARALCGRVDSF